MSTEADLKAELERLRAENEALKTRGSKAVSMKVSEKGCLLYTSPSPRDGATSRMPSSA